MFTLWKGENALKSGFGISMQYALILHSKKAFRQALPCYNNDQSGKHNKSLNSKKHKIKTGNLSFAIIVIF